MTLVIGLAIRSAVILALGLLLSACLTKRSAALRHRVMAASLLAAVAVTPLSLVLPEWTLTVPSGLIAPTPAAAPALVIEPRTSRAAGPARSHPPGTGTSLAASATPGTFSPVVALWLAGLVLSAGPLIAGLVQVRRLAARACRIDDRRWLRICDNVAAQYRLRRDVVIARSGSADLLATWGILRPQVLVPDSAQHWTLERVHIVLCHELAHIRRHDWLVQTGAEMVRALFWFNPLAWIVCRRLRRESEHACDDEVLGIGVRGQDYAVHLLELARQCRRPGATWAAVIPMAHTSTLERRITAMLNPQLDRRAPSGRVSAALALLFVLVMLPVAILSARQAGPSPLRGTIYDVSGGVLPGVEVALVDATQSRWTAITNARGRFELPAVGAGKYELEAALPGFRALRQEFELREPRDWDRAVTLQVGELSETIVISASRVAPSDQPAPAAGEPVRIGGNVRAPRKEKHVAPVYPPAMRDAGLTAVVPVEAIIGRDGTVSSVRVLSAQVHPDFAMSAVDAVRQWRFTPTLLNGTPVDVAMTVTLRFALQD